MKRFIRLFSIFLLGGLLIIFFIAVYFYPRVCSVDKLFDGIASLLVIFTVFAFGFAVFLSNREEKVYKYLRDVVDDLKNSKEPEFPHFNDRELVKLFSGIKEIYKTLKRNNLIIEEEKNKLKFVINSIDDGILLLNKGNLELLNKKACELLGIKDSSGNIIDLLSNHLFVNVFEEILKSDKLEKEIESQGRWFFIKSITLDDRKLVVIRDITKQKNYALLKAKFFEDASHELKTPITSILGYSETLLGGGIDEKMSLKFFGYIHQNAKNLAELVEDILTLHRLEKQKEPIKGECNLSNILDELKISFGNLAKKKGIDFMVEIEDKSVSVPCGYIKSILWNLVDNAIKYTDNGHVKIECKSSNSEFTIIVEDTGSGISQKHLPYIFDRFYTTQKGRNRRISGTGLGLSIVKHIVQLYGGSIDVKSEPLKGSKFTIKIPYA
ncbi:sensor histidine kinase [Hippea alviniae]|uniref:sensor histidine kinase n=1 Tax=Hippea alviniae TaxID=1279027 RepID=UPI0003B34606|nr:ATP-binding protein [Hippea alviniae]